VPRRAAEEAPKAGDHPASVQFHEWSTDRIGAIVVGGDYQGLGITRSLGKRGVPICIIDDEVSIAGFSRYATHRVQVEDLHDERRTVDSILTVGRQLGLEGWVLYPTRDETVAAFARHRPVLSEWFRVPTPDWSSIQWAWDKRNTYRLAEDLAIPTPRTWYPQNSAELMMIEAELPLVIKPAIKEHFIYATKAKAWRADTREELAERFQQAATLIGPGETMVQELIPGDGRQQFAYCCFFKAGRAVASMVVQRRRQHPPEFGRASTFVETVDVPVLESLSERFLRAIDYYGLVELEYKLDPRDGQYKLLDVNARTWGYHTLGPRAGVDFTSLLFADQRGETVEPCRARSGVGWVRLTTDLPSGVIEILGGRLGWGEYVRSLKGAHTEAVFSRDDPLPALIELVLIPYLLVKRGF
jgi:D-aspartate ligase